MVNIYYWISPNKLGAATKSDIEELRSATKLDIEGLRKDMGEMEVRLKYDLTLRMGIMITAGVMVMAALKLLS